MTKFKVGDRIRRIEGSVTDAPIGYESVVLGFRFEGSEIYYEDARGDKMYSLSRNWELVNQGSVRTETITRKVPVNGTYGVVGVGPVAIGLSVYRNDPQAAEQLRAAAKTLLELAECFE